MSVPSGWYEDPFAAGYLRYWDGVTWTVHQAPAPVMPPPAQVVQSAPVVPPPAPVVPPPAQVVQSAPVVPPPAPVVPPPAPVAPPGWYPDPQIPNSMRYWDGSSWIDTQGWQQSQAQSPHATQKPSWISRLEAMGAAERVRREERTADRGERTEEWTELKDEWAQIREERAQRKEERAQRKEERTLRKEVKIQRKDEKVQRKEEKAQQKESKLDSKELQARELESQKPSKPREHGKKVADEIFGLHSIRIYSGGYVRVARPLRGRSARFEQLRVIEVNANVSKKTGIGRAATAIITAGDNLVFSPNTRGDIYLTIATDVKTHVFHVEPPTNQALKAAYTLKAAGQATLQQYT